MCAASGTPASTETILTANVANTHSEAFLEELVILITSDFAIRIFVKFVNELAAATGIAATFPENPHLGF
jgi:hypothetical protein